MSTSIVIAGAKRTAIGSMLGQFTGVPTTTLGATAIKAATTRKLMRSVTRSASDRVADRAIKSAAHKARPMAIRCCSVMAARRSLSR